MSWTKGDILAYGLDKGFEVDESMTKQEMLDIILADNDSVDG